MKRLLTILPLFFSLLLAAQDDSSFQHIRTIKGDIIAMEADNLDNLYLVNSQNQLRKLDSKGDSMAVFNDVRKCGKATLIDVSNALKGLF